MVVVVANRERTLYGGAFGKLDARGTFDMSTDALFLIKSMTKPVTSVAIMMLKVQGMLDLGDPVGRYLPKLKNAEVIAAFDLKPEDHNRLASLFTRINGKFVWIQPPALYKPEVFGDQGLLATADDYMLFLQMLLNGGQFGGKRLLTERSVEEMTRNQIGPLTVEEQPNAMLKHSNPFPFGAGEDKFGLGFQLKEREEDDARSSGSCSWAGLYNTHFWGDLKLGIAVVLMTQALPFYDGRCIQLLMDIEKRIYRNLD